VVWIDLTQGREQRRAVVNTVTNLRVQLNVGEIPDLTANLGRAVAQAVSSWLPTAAAQVRVRAACGVCGGQSGIGAGFLRVLRFPLPIIPPISLSP
jgi:hypothetical protein